MLPGGGGGEETGSPLGHPATARHQPPANFYVGERFSETDWRAAGWREGSAVAGAGLVCKVRGASCEVCSK